MGCYRMEFQVQFIHFHLERLQMVKHLNSEQWFPPRQDEQELLRLGLFQGLKLLLRLFFLLLDISGLSHPDFIWNEQHEYLHHFPWYRLASSFPHLLLFVFSNRLNLFQHFQAELSNFQAVRVFLTVLGQFPWLFFYFQLCYLQLIQFDSSNHLFTAN